MILLALDVMCYFNYSTPLAGLCFGIMRVDDKNLKPASIGNFLMMHILSAIVVTFTFGVGFLFIIPGCCCGNHYQSCVDSMCGSLWVRKTSYNALLDNARRAKGTATPVDEPSAMGPGVVVAVCIFLIGGYLVSGIVPCGCADDSWTATALFTSHYAMHCGANPSSLRCWVSCQLSSRALRSAMWRACVLGV